VVIHYTNFFRVDVFVMAEEISLDEWLASIGGITEAGRTKLEKATIVNVNVVKLLEEEDINQIRLGIGDRAVFKAGWESVRSVKRTLASPEVPVVPVVPEEEGAVAAPISRERLYSIEDLSKFLGGLGREPAGTGASLGGGRLQEPAVASTSASVPLRVPSPADRDLPVTVKSLAKDRLLSRLASEYVTEGLANTLSLTDLQLDRGEKPLLPINFCTVLNGGIIEEEEILSGQNNGRLVWQSGRGNLRRPTPDKLSFGQFYEASARIFKLLNLSGQQELEYLDYQRQLGILLQTFTQSSVFLLDHLHRQFVFASNSKWHVIENSLENSVLKKRDEGHKLNSTPSRKFDSSSKRDQGKSGDNGEKVCWMYNLHKGCSYGESCYYPHVCSMGNCRQKHPAYKHFDQSANAPRARNNNAQPANQSP
jgi:hypothetical protein